MYCSITGRQANRLYLRCKINNYAINQLFSTLIFRLSSSSELQCTALWNNRRRRRCLEGSLTFFARQLLLCPSIHSFSISSVVVELHLKYSFQIIPITMPHSLRLPVCPRLLDYGHDETLSLIEFDQKWGTGILPSHHN